MKPVLETVVRCSPAVWSAIPIPSSAPRNAPAAKPERPRLRSRGAPAIPSTPVAIA